MHYLLVMSFLWLGACRFCLHNSSSIMAGVGKNTFLRLTIKLQKSYEFNAVQLSTENSNISVTPGKYFLFAAAIAAQTWEKVALMIA